MFWQIVLFIVITFGIIVLRALGKASEDEEGIIAFISFLLTLGMLFYMPFAIQWSLRFIIGYVGLSYWQIMGLYVLRNSLFNKLKDKEDLY